MKNQFSISKRFKYHLNLSFGPIATTHSNKLFFQGLGKAKTFSAVKAKLSYDLQETTSSYASNSFDG